MYNYFYILFITEGKALNWLNANITITLTGVKTYQIIFEGTIGEDYKSDIAVDDIYLRKGNCKLCLFNVSCELNFPRQNYVIKANYSD